MKRPFIPGVWQQIKAFALEGSANGAGTAGPSVPIAEPVEARVMLSAAHPAAASPGGNGITGEYFAGSDFQQAKMVRTDPAIAFSQPQGTPERVIPHGAYSVRWTGQVEALYSETYTFLARTNGGVEVWVNDQLLIDDFTPHPLSTSTATIALQAGQKYDLRVDYFQNGTGPSNIHLRWSSASQHRHIIPKADLFTDPTVTLPGGAGLTGEYFQSMNFTHPVLTRLDRRVDFDWGGLTPDAEIPHTPFSVIWTGQVQAQYSEPYRFYTDADDGTRLYINGNLVINDFGQHSAELAASKPMMLQAGQEYDVKLEYYENTVPPASCKFLWSSPSTPLRVVPAGALSSTLIAPATPTDVTATGNSSSQITVAWAPVAGATSYLVERSTTPDGSSGYTTVGTTSAVMLADTGLQPATTYYYRVTAENSAGNSAPTGLVPGTTLIPAYAAITTIYGLTTTTNSVYSVDTTTGAATQIGSLAFGTSAAGRDPASGKFYYVSTGTSTVQVATWDPTVPPTSANTLVNGNVPVTGLVTRAAFRDDGAFFFISGFGDLNQYNTTTNTATLLGTIMVGGAPLPYNNGDMAFAPDGTLYIETASMLYSVTPAAISGATGPGSNIAATLIGPTGTPDLQVAFGQNGVLFGYDQNGQIYTINPNTAAATVVPGSTPSGVALGDLASVPLYADLSVTQSASALSAGSNGTYTITVANAGPDATIQPTTVTDTLPAGIMYVSASGTGWAFNVSGQTLTMQYGGNVAKNTTLPAVTVTVGVSAAAKPSVTNTAVVSSTIFDTNTANNTSVLTTPVS